LALFDGLDEHGGREQRIVSARIEPCNAASQQHRLQLPAMQVFEIDVGDFELAAPGGLQRPGDFHDLVVVDVETGLREARSRLLRFFFYRHYPAIAVELDDAVALR